ncbi:MAG TPA: chemotaxis protein CheW [Thermoanaerobaculia bacterium]|nr:chemotaxis protein CheW [Thermoanaerobaculia bacterium]
MKTDWNEIRRRIEAAQEAVDRGWSPDRETARRIFQARAEALAREQEAPEPDDARDFVVFELGRETYAIESSFIREIDVLSDLTPLPCTPPFVLGIVNLRGEIVSVIDIRRFFDLPEKGLGDLNKMIVLESPRMRFGLLADAIAGVRRIALRDIQPSLPTLTGIRERYLKGVNSERIVFLDGDKLLSDATIVVQEHVQE